MKVLRASWRNELDKLMRRKKYFVFLCIGLGICLIWAGIGQLISSFARSPGSISVTLAPTPMGALPFFSQVMIPFLMFMGITDLITVEGAEGTMKAMLCRPVPRRTLYNAKLMAVMTYAVTYLLSVFVICFILTLLLGRPGTVSGFFTALASYILTFIPLAVLACYAALIALCMRSGTLVMFLLIFSYILLNALPIIFPILSEMLFTSYLSWYRLWIGALPATAKLITMLLTVLSTGTLLYTAGSLLFDKVDY